ncbi:MMPL family transporter [Hazenella coriacea]|uniref:RND superfamily putative drug exporter n=1 Tax=Hazenella coriacea TaxID=1179467 RepID=A0A4R3L1R6_9BACL|nr:MMPL family transporter [Hazenella coriacea]TCS93483.1 RND superfamily putative drug exporter [Hazenella coriacea]
MKWIIKSKWLWLAVWIMTLIALLMTMPSIDRLVREKGQPEIGEGYTSKMAIDLEKQMSGSDQGGKNVEAVIAFHHQDGINESQLKQIEQKLKEIEASSKLDVSSMLSPFANEQAKEQLISKDNKTVMAVVSISKEIQTISEIRDQLAKEVRLSGVETYLTGNDFIIEDYAQTSLDGVAKTEIFAVLFIVIILILVFRSPITPVISLLIVGITYLISLGTVMHLVESFDFPFANTTQTFLILVLFGIGTDYNILLFMRFKEEMSKQRSIPAAIIETYRTAGKTVLFSGLAVFIGFSMLWLAEFGIYRSAVAIAIGIMILLAVLFTLVPFCLAIMGNYLFWPMKKTTGHQESRLWSWMGRFSVKRSFLSLALVAVLTIPVMLLHNGNLSFNSLAEVNPEFESVKGFEIVSDSFGPGRSMPTTVYMKNDQPLDSVKSLAFLDQLHQRLTQIDGVESVFGPTRPTGERIDQLYINKQTEDVNKGLNQSTDGLDQISSGLSEASSRIQGATSGDLNDVGKLVSGTDSARSGLGQIQDALTKIQGGVKKGAGGATDISKGMADLEKGLQQVSASTQQLSSGYQKLEGGYTSLNREYQKLEGQIGSIQGAVDVIQSSAQKMGQDHPELATDVNLITIQQTSSKLSSQLPQLRGGLQTLNGTFTGMNNELKKANSGLAKIADGQQELTVGATKLRKGTAELASGLEQGATGQGKVIQSLDQIDAGLQKINQGQEKLQQGLQQFSGSFKELQTGLSQSANGLDEISGGLQKANEYLAQVTGSEATQTFFIPDSVRKQKDFQSALDAYMSEDRKIAKWTVSLNVDPYSEEAMTIAEEIDSAVKEYLAHTEYKDVEVGTGGVSSMNQDLYTMSSQDFAQAVIWMLVGIGVMLLLLFRSFWTTIVILFSLVIAYYSSLSLTELIFINGLGEVGLSWTIPFFSFVMIIALGVDYSIFLMMRYKEYELQTPTIAIQEAMKNIGSVIISAALILCFTFAAMYPSGVTTLLQISTVVILGLLLLAFVLLPLLLPAVIALMDQQSRKEKARKRQIKEKELVN